ncbi:MAG: hypothetical protein ACI9OJ_005399, partial [Myxococcota bacterium]
HFRAAAETTLRWSAARLERSGPAMPAMLSALDMLLDKPRQVIVVRAPDDAALPLMAEIRKAYLPNRIIVEVDDGEPVKALKALVPAVAQKFAQGGKTTAYVCEGGRCQRPTSDPKVLAQQLKGAHPYP